MKPGWYVFIIGMCLFLGCSIRKISFTPLVKQEVINQKIAVKNLHFYNDRSIILFRKVASKEEKKPYATLRKKQGEWYEYIIIPTLAPGFCIAGEQEDMLVISWHEKTAGLQFNLTKEGTYQLVAKSWANGTGRIDYAGATYTIAEKSAHTILKISSSDLINN